MELGGAEEATPAADDGAPAFTTMVVGDAEAEAAENDDDMDDLDDLDDDEEDDELASNKDSTGAYKKCDSCLKQLNEKNTRNQKRVDLRRERDRKANRAKDKKLQRLQKKCRMLEAKLKLVEKAPRCIDEIDIDKLLKDVVRKNAAAGSHVPIDMVAITASAREMNPLPLSGEAPPPADAPGSDAAAAAEEEDASPVGASPVAGNIFDKFRFEDFAKEQVHNANCKPQGRRFSDGLFDWCLSIFKTSKKAYREFVRNAPELYLPSERTLQYIQAQRRARAEKAKQEVPSAPSPPAEQEQAAGPPAPAPAAAAGVVPGYSGADVLPSGGLQQAIVEADTGMQMGDAAMEEMVGVAGAHA